MGDTGVDHRVHLKDGRIDEGQPRNQRVRRPAAQQAAERTKTELFISCMRIVKIDSFNF